MTGTPTQSHPKLAYLRAEVETADPLKILNMLYNRLIRELKEVRDLLALEKDSAEQVSSVEILGKFDRCRGILSHLLESLDPQTGELSQRLQALYGYFYQKILTAQMEKDGRVIDEILPNLETLREGWLGITNEKVGV